MGILNLKTLLVIVFTSLVSVHARADVTGLWQGYGQWAYDGSAVPCLLTIRYQETATELKRHKGSLQCDIVNMYSDPLTWIKKDSELLLEGESAGAWSDEGFRSLEMANDTVEVETELRLHDAKSASYSEIWRQKASGDIIYEVTAELKR